MDSKDQKEAATAKRLQRLQLADADFLAVVSTASGRRFIKRMFAESGVHRGSYNGDINSTLFLEGKRSIGLWIQSLFDRICPDKYILLLTENINERANDTRPADND